MKIIALTGGIATGKTTVGRMFAELGAVVLNADTIAHSTYDPGTKLYREMIRRYEKKKIAPHGFIDRRALGEILFRSPTEKKWLESKIHPATILKIGQSIRRAIKKKPPLILVEAALHVETGYYRCFPGVIVVVAPERVQLARLIKRESLSTQEALQRIRQQMPLAEKRRYADWIVDNGGSLKKTFLQVKKLFRQLTNSAPSPCSSPSTDI